MPVHLCFDTSAAHCAAVLVRDGDVVAARIEPMTRGQAEALMPLLERMLEDAGLCWRDLGAVGVGIGPGNFTGTRIAVSAARGLSLGLGVPAIGLSAFDMMRLTAPGDAAACLVSLPAPRDHAYVQIWRDDAVEPAHVIDPSSPSPDLARNGAVRVIGHRARELAPAIGCVGLDHAVDDVPTALALALTAALRPGVRSPRPAPLYVRPADAAPPRDAPPVIVP